MSTHPTFIQHVRISQVFRPRPSVINMLLCPLNLLATSFALRQGTNARTLGTSRLLCKKYTQLYTMRSYLSLCEKRRERFHVK